MRRLGDYESLARHSSCNQPVAVVKVLDMVECTVVDTELERMVEAKRFDHIPWVGFHTV